MTKVQFKGNDFWFNNSPTLPFLLKEIFSDNYHIFQSGLQFSDGDIVIDAGANEGVFSILIAKMFPQVKVISLEPVFSTYKFLLANIGLNNLINIHTALVGVSGKSGNEEMVACNDITGGSSVMVTPDPSVHKIVTVHMDTLDNRIDDLRLEGRKIKLLKIDIEGSEYEVLFNSQRLKEGMIENMVGEFHINTRLEQEGYSIDMLAGYVSQYTNLLFYESCRMAE
jgi:FkbM family methyltransferase